MSKRADALVIRVAQPEERDELEELQRRASLANENDRPHLEAHPDAIHLPPAQIANGQLVFDIDVMPPPPAERLTFQTFIDVSLLQSLERTTAQNSLAAATA